MFAFISATLGFFSKLGVAIGIAFAAWTVYYTVGHKDAIVRYNLASTYESKGAVVEPFMTAKTDLVKGFQRDAFRYNAWYASKTVGEKAMWLCIWCPLMGILFGSMVLCILLNAFIGFILKALGG
jgi:hypothetical protein